MNLLRKLVALVAVLAILYAAISLAGTDLLWAIVIPILLLIGALIAAPPKDRREHRPVPIFQFFPVIASRAPPCC